MVENIKIVNDLVEYYLANSGKKEAKKIEKLLNDLSLVDVYKDGKKVRDEIGRIEKEIKKINEEKERMEDFLEGEMEYEGETNTIIKFIHGFMPHYYGKEHKLLSDPNMLKKWKVLKTHLKMYSDINYLKQDLLVLNFELDCLYLNLEEVDSILNSEVTFTKNFAKIFIDFRKVVDIL